MNPARKEMDAHAQGFVVNEELLHCVVIEVCVAATKSCPVIFHMASSVPNLTKNS
jgi:hypothetical protein